MQTIAIPALYRSLHGYLMQRIPDECESRLTNLIWLMMGIFQARSVQLNLAARKVPIRAKKLSIVKRFSRFVRNGSVQVREWYHPFATTLLKNAAVAGQVRLIIDASKVSHSHRLLMVSVAAWRRSVPIAWTWVRSARGHSSTAQQVKLLAYVNHLLPSGVKVSLVGDCEFDHPLLIENLRFWGWDYALRQPGNHLVQSRSSTGWRRLDRFTLKPGMSLWLGYVVLTKASPFPTHLVLHWRPGEKEPWFLATNLLSPQVAVRLYRLRMWIEEMFGDLKKHGFDLEMTHLRHFLRLSRLTLIVCLLYLWLMAMGEYVLFHHLTAQVDRTDRRDLSVFRLGWDFLEDCLRLLDPIPQVAIPNFSSVSGG
jgi:Transposase DDE domain